MTDLEQQRQIVTMLETALVCTIEAQRIEQRMSHTPHPHPCYTEIQSRLEGLRDSERAIMKRMETVGR